MYFSVQLPTDQPGPDAAFWAAPALAEAAQAAEQAGFDAVFATDHPAPPESWLQQGGRHALDPFSALACAAVATRRLRLQTHLLVAAYRNPFLSAKALASLDALSGGRLIVGLGAGYLRAEFAALGADFDRREALLEESVRVLRRAFSERAVSEQGLHFDAQEITIAPGPVQGPGPPLWLGGNSRRALRRAVEQADGWLPFAASRSLARVAGTAPLEDMHALAEALAYAREHARHTGRRAPLEVCFTPRVDAGRGLPEAGPLVAAIRRSGELGVTWTALNIPCRSRAEYAEKVAWLGENIVRPIREN